MYIHKIPIYMCISDFPIRKKEKARHRQVMKDSEHVLYIGQKSSGKKLNRGRRGHRGYENGLFYNWKRNLLEGSSWLSYIQDDYFRHVSY